VSKFELSETQMKGQSGTILSKTHF